MADFMHSCLVKKFRGGYTVEAAVLIPIGFALMLLFISYSLIHYDEAALCAEIHEISQKEGFQKSGSGERTEGEWILPAALSQISMQIERSEIEITVSGSGNSKFLSPLIRAFFLLEEPHLENQEHVDLIYGEQIIRERELLMGEKSGS